MTLYTVTSYNLLFHVIVVCNWQSVDPNAALLAGKWQT